MCKGVTVKKLTSNSDLLIGSFFGGAVCGRSFLSSFFNFERKLSPKCFIFDFLYVRAY